ncbi:ABC transporter substrate-binding protein [Oceanobacillus alkalisoli]|uniref:ABC transporter substrate-binding protein n=1 Tax=Oceanobacillus alkalisoli TaxID=2925113 RepID=UPI001EE4E3DA|nr:ABC transporter substrate-binding protein [Oceanobacillus alkalisoli]MCG5102386.1 ABC transporter substrate-binding protein [Oceanobacillus alkalisoli]
MKSFKTLLVLVAMAFIVVGCGGGSGDSGKVELSYYASLEIETEKDTLDSLIEKFEEENPDIDIVVNYPGDFESQLRVKMAANDLPDLFDTHGWAKNRYGEYTEDLSDMDWVADLDPALEEILVDEDGKVYAYPINQAKDGLTYNAALLEEYGIEPPSTFDELMEALETVKEESDGEVTPLWFAGSDKGALAQFFDQFATPLLITADGNQYGDELLDQSFDWDNYTYLPEKLKEMQEKELLNTDVLTAQVHERSQLFAQDKIAFIMASLPAESILELNPDVNLGVMPVPAIHETGEPSWIGGERHTVAVWKDSEHKEEAKRFIEFLSQPEHVKTLAEATNLPAGLTNAEVDIYYEEDYETYADVMVEPYFDRIYLPSGMWDVLGNTGQELLSGTLTPEQVSEQMEQEFTRLLGQD